MKNIFADKIKQAYDAISHIWHEKREWYIEQAPIDELITQLPQKATILDVGCGSGKPIAKYLLGKGFDVYGIDISPKQIEHAKQIISEDKLFVGDICTFTTPLTFDAIICWCTLFHIHASQHLDVLKKLRSILKPNGVMLITFAETSAKPEGTDIKVIDEHTIESEMFGERFKHSGNPAKINAQLMIDTGFKIISDKIDQPGNQVILAIKETV